MQEISKTLELPLEEATLVIESKPESTEEQSLSLEHQSKREEQASDSPQIDKAGSDVDVDLSNEDDECTRLLEMASSSENSDFSPKRVLSVGQSMHCKNRGV